MPRVCRTQVDAPMTPRQLATLRTLSAEAYQPKLFENNLTAKGGRAPDYGAEGGDRAGEFVLKRTRKTRMSVATSAARRQLPHIAEPLVGRAFVSISVTRHL